MTIRLTEAEQFVLARITEALQVWSRDMTPIGPHGYGCGWPDMLREAGEVFANAVEQGRYEAMRARLGQPDGAAIDRAIEVAHWLVWVRKHLGVKKVRFLCALAIGKPWYWLEGQFRRRRSQLYRWRKESLALVVLQLGLTMPEN